MTSPATPANGLWSYTCEHGYQEIGDEGVLLPARDLAPALLDWPPAAFIWATDLARPNRDALGLTQALSRCDRTRYRYRILNPDQFTHWPQVRRDPTIRRLAVGLEAAPGARPMHWWCTREPAAVVYDPLSPNPIPTGKESRP